MDELAQNRLTSDIFLSKSGKELEHTHYNKTVGFPTSQRGVLSKALKT